MTDVLRVYGSSKTFRSKLAERAKLGTDLILRSEGIRHTIEAEGISANDKAEKLGIRWAVTVSALVQPLGTSAQTWTGTNRRLVERYLGPKAKDVYPGGYDGVAPRNLSYEDLPILEAQILDHVERLRALERALPAPRTLAVRAVDLVALDELRASGLFDAEVVDDFEGRISSLGTRRQWSGAIGAAKELVEALHRAVLHELNAPKAPSSIDFVKLGKLARRAIQAEQGLQGLPSASVDNAIRLDQGLSHVLNSLTELRNAEGQGHGRPRINPGLSLRHAELATESAVVYSRYIVATMNELGRLPRH